MAVTAADVKILREKTGAGMLDCRKALEEAQGNFEEAETILKKMGLAAVAKRSDRATELGRVFTSVSASRGTIVELGCETDFVAMNEQFVATGKEIAALANAGNLGITDAGLLAKVTEIAAVIKENITLRRIEHFAIGADEAVDTYIHGDAGSVGVLVKFKFGKADLKTNEAVKTFMHDCALHGAAFKPQFMASANVSKEWVAKQEEIFKAQIDGDEKNASKPEQVKTKMLEGKIKKLFSEVCFLEQAFVKDDKFTVAQMAAQVGKTAGSTVDMVEYRIYSAGEALQA